MFAQPFGNERAMHVKYLVGEFTIDTARYRISAGDTVMPVEPKVFDLLVHLIRHRDRVLTREELFKDVWNGREVSDATLSNHVKSARKILGDNGDLQQTILTVRSRGYQFVAPVREIPDEAAGPVPAPMLAAAAAPDQPAADPASPPATRPRWRVPLFALAVLLLSGMALTWRMLPPPAAAVSADRPYVLVVPFGVSGDASETWQPFADQATREVIRNLRKVSGLRVVPVTSAFTFKGNKSRAHIRAQLPEVRYVLDGVVSIAADKTLRITAELEDLHKGGTVWDQDYTGRADDTNLFAMQSGIAAAVSQSLKVAILDDELRAMGELPTSNLKAYELYVAGRHQLELVSHESLPRAIALFNQAIALDPKFFDAFIARSDAYRQLFAYFEPPINMLQAVIDSIAAARELSPRLCRGLVIAGPDLCHGLALEGCLDGAQCSQAARPEPGADRTRFRALLLRPGRGRQGQARAGSRQSLGPAERRDGGLGQLGSVHGGRARRGAGLGGAEDAAAPGHRTGVLRRRHRRFHRRRP